MNFPLLDKVHDLYEHFASFFWGIGYFGWQASATYALYVSYLVSWIDMVVFALVFVLSGWVNHIVLKNYINDPRPAGSMAFLANEHIKLHQNGMPSGHAQLTAYSLVFSYLYSGRYLYESIALFAVTIFQRFMFKNHTAAQLFAGSVLGVAVAYFTVYVLKQSKARLRR